MMTFLRRISPHWANPDLDGRGQLAAIITAISAGCTAIALAVRWGLGRIAKAFDDQARGAVDECRADSASTLAAAREARRLSAHPQIL
jgi:hypothetical protein